MPWCRLNPADEGAECLSSPKGNESTVPRVLSFGEVLWDLLPTGPVLGGAPFNLAFRLNSLGYPVRMASRVGMDSLGEEALARMAGFGMDSGLIRRDSQFPTGTVRVSLGPDGEPDFRIEYPAAYDFIELSGELEEAARAAGCICFGSLAQREKTSRETLHRLIEAAPSALKVLDINLRRDCFTRETVTGSLDRADILKLNDSEVLTLAGMLDWEESGAEEFCAAAVERFGLRCCVVTLGARGALAHSAGEGTVHAPGFEVRVVDTVGSGDAFTAGFLDGWFRGLDLRACCRRGNVLGALNAARAGATAVVDESEIRALENLDYS